MANLDHYRNKNHHLILKDSITANTNTCANNNNFTFQNKVKEIDEADVIEFERLLNCVSVKELQATLRKVCMFLRGSDDELEFEELTLPLEEILVKIVKSVDILKTKKMYGSCKLYVQQIINIVTEKSRDNVFMLICVYKKNQQEIDELGAASQVTLVYKKLYYTKVTSKNELMSSLSTTPPISRSASMDSLRSQRSSKNINQTNPFQTHCLNLILQFVKDVNQPVLKFTDLSNTDADFLYILFSGVIDYKYDEGLRSNDLYVAIWEAVKVLGLKFEFCIKFVDSGYKKSLVLAKSNKRTHPDNIRVTIDLPEENHIISNRKIRRYKPFIDDLPPDFVIDSLKKIVEFFMDDTAASIIFETTETVEKLFLRNILSYSSSPTIRGFMSEEAKRLMEKISSLSENRIFKLRIKDIKNGGGKKVLSFNKIPKFENCAPWTQKGPSTDYSEMNEIRSTSSSSRKMRRQAKRAKQSGIEFQPAGLLDGKRNDNNCSVESDKDVLRDAMSKYAANASLTELEFAQDRRLRSKNVQTNYGSKKMMKEQLVEALSVPVTSDKAMKMMRSMGWEGGALGSKGQGITEPIMPHLNCGSGFGLGHNKTKPIVPNLVSSPPKTKPLPLLPSSPRCPPQIKQPFKQQFLNQLLCLITTQENSTSVKLSSKISKKEKRFLKDAMNAFAMRSRLYIGDENQYMVNKISDLFENNPDLVVSACISDKKTQVTLTKIHTNEEKKNIKKETSIENMKILIQNSGSHCMKEESLESLEFRHDFLKKILNFIKLPSENKLILHFWQELPGKQRTFIDLVVRNANRKKQFGKINTVVALFLEVIKCMTGEFILDLKYTDNFKTCKISKVYKLNKEVSNKDNLNNSMESIYEEVQYNIFKNDWLEHCDLTVNDTTDKAADSDTNDIIDTTDVNQNKPQSKKSASIIEIKDDCNKTKKDNEFIVISDENTGDSSDVNDEKRRRTESIELSIHNSSNMSDDFNNTFDCDDLMSLSDYSNYTTNLDYGESDCNDDISMTDLKAKQEKSSINDKSDINIELSEKSDVRLENNVTDVLTFAYLTVENFYSEDMAIFIQGLISMHIEQSKELPLLKCYGIKNDFLLYSCHDKKSYDWLHKMCVDNKITILTKEFFNMSLKINSYLDFDYKYFFSLLEKYNKDVSTNDWRVLKKEVFNDSVVFDLRLDKKSFKYIVDCNLALYAGIDKVNFTIMFE